MLPETTSQMPEVSDPFNRMDERALINILPSGFQEMLLKAHAARPELFGLSEREFEKAADIGERGPGPMANALRMKFWFEYDEAQAEHRKMKITRIYAGVCEVSQLYTQLKDPVKAAWILTRPTSYEAATEEMHQFALSRLRKILEIETKSDSRMGKLQLDIFMALDARIKGAVVQKTLNVHSTVPPGKVGIPENAKKEELERRIKELERVAEKNRAKIIDATVVKSE